MDDTPLVDGNVDTTAIALQAVAAGWVLTPVAPGSKRPLRTGWQLLAHAVTTREQVLTTVRVHGPCSWGVLPAYSDLGILDLDRLDEALSLLAEQYDIDLPPLLAAPGTRIRSGSPGHDKRCYRLPEGADPADYPTVRLLSPRDGGVVLEFRCSDGRGHSVQDLITGRHPSGPWYSIEPVVDGAGSVWDPPVLPEPLAALWRALVELQRRAAPTEDQRGVDALALAVAHRRATLDTVEDLRSALAHLGTVTYEPWMRYSLALRALADQREDLAEAVHEAWLEWTLAADNYSAGDEEKWERGFASARGAVTYASIFYEAAAAGWHNPRKRRQPLTIDALFEDLTEPEPVPDPWASLDAALEAPAAEDPAPEPEPEPEPAPASAFGNPFLPAPLPSMFQEPEQRWWLKTVLPEAELAAVIGARASGKTFFALDVLLHIAQGWRWRGLRTRQTPVCVIAGEGYRGLVKRLRALCQHYGLDPATVPIDVIKAPPNLLDVAQVRLLLQGLQAGAARWGRPYGIILIDTLATSMPGGNENSSEDMGRTIAACKAIHRKTGALVWLVHHLGKDVERGARGWSGLGAALDAEITVTRVDAEAALRVARLTKSKDGIDGTEWPFELEQVELGVDADGDPITSARVISAAPADPEVVQMRRAERLRDRPRAVWIAFQAQRGNFVGGAVPADLVIDRAVEIYGGDAPPEGGRDRRRDSMWRALRGLVDRGLLGLDGDYVRAQQGAELFVDVGPEED